MTRVRGQKARHRELSRPTATPTGLAAVEAALTSGQWAYGPRARYLEARIASEIGVPEDWVVATDSCSTALAAAGHLFLQGSPPPRVCPLTWPSTYMWAPEVDWVDCTEEGWPERPVDVGVELWGRAWPDLPLPLILDCAHRALDPRHGELVRGGDVQALCYSFAPQKEYPSFCGGALVTPPAHIERAREWLRCGTTDRVYTGHGGRKGLIPDVAAALVHANLKRRASLDRRRQEILRRYEELLGTAQLLTRAGEASGHLAVINAFDPAVARLYRSSLEKVGIEWGHHYPIPELLRDVTPGAWELSRRILSLPCHVAMNERDVRRVATRILSA